MNNSKTLTFYLPSPMRKHAIEGNVNIVNKIAAAIANCGFTTIIKNDSDINLLKSADDPGYSMFLMEEPFHPRALTLRRAYYYPFWRIESTARRWDWEVAKAAFDPGRIDQKEADSFVDFWRKRLNGESKIPQKTGDYVYVPLQGRLLECRSFQSASPIEMLETTLLLEPDREIRATLHPKERYSTTEMEALEALESKYPNFSVSTANDKQLLGGCSYVVTQNSGIALDGYFYDKPAVLFGKIDFHHIAANTRDLGNEGAFSAVGKMRPQYSKYLFWFLQKMSINAGRQDAGDRILETLRRRGWNL
ncbi:MAG: hypothetical protein ACU0CA_07950 [Paracoccaceae bacterium]